MTSRPTVTIHGADGKPGSETATLPNVFKAPIRQDIVQYGFPETSLKEAMAERLET